jgi:nucleoside triphosphate diphosphatase
MQDKSALERAMATVRDLRKRCAWDRAQTRETLRPYLVEEVLELDHALAEGEVEQIRAEVSDLLLHLAFQLVIAEERNEFTAGEVADQLEGKMRRRHPHLFDLGDAQPWEHIKRRERQGGVLAGLLPTLPPLLMATRLQERAASVGFDWPNVEGPMAKIREELDEVERELAPQARSGPAKHTADPNPPGGIPTEELVNEIGDLLFAVVNVARKVGVDAENALIDATSRFQRRFEAVEDALTDRGKTPATSTLEEMDALWDDVKRRERQQ